MGRRICSVPNIAGEIDLENKSTLTRKEIIDISINKNINFHGKVLDMKIYSKQI